MSRKAYLRPIGYVLLFLCLTLVFSLINYPRENLTAALNRQLSRISDEALSVQSVSYRPPISLKLKGVVVEVGGGRQVLGDAVVTPHLFALLAGKKSVSGRLDGPWAASRFKALSRDNGWNIDVNSLKLKLDALPLPESLPVEFSGGAEADLKLEVPDLSDIRLGGQGQISGTDIRASGDILESLGLSPLEFPSLSLFFTVQDNVLTLNENDLTGDISGNARGTVKLVPERPGSSRLDLILDIRPGIEVRERLSSLFSLLGVRQRSNGSVIIRIRGTLDRPSVTS